MCNLINVGMQLAREEEFHPKRETTRRELLMTVVAVVPGAGNQYSNLLLDLFKIKTALSALMCSMSIKIQGNKSLSVKNAIIILVNFLSCLRGEDCLFLANYRVLKFAINYLSFG
jgi:hypothetical protein